MKQKRQYEPEFAKNFTLEEVEFSVLDDRAPERKTARRNYKDAYFSLAHDIRRTACRVEACLIESADGPQLAALLADLDDALEEAERRLLSGE